MAGRCLMYYETDLVMNIDDPWYASMYHHHPGELYACPLWFRRNDGRYQYCGMNRINQMEVIAAPSP